MSLCNIPKVCFIILNYQGANDTIECLNSILINNYKNYCVVVVDNASADSSVDIINQYFTNNKKSNFIYFKSPEIAMQSKEPQYKYTLIKSQVNGGYGAGNNIGIKYALKNKYIKYILLLNNDTIVDSNFLGAMVQLCEQDRTIGIATGKIYYNDRPDTIWFNGGMYSPCISKVVHMNYGEKDIGQKKPENITFVTGCLWLIPRKVVQEVGFINEEYFMYFEDVEYCQRVLGLGYRLELCSESVIWHKIGSSVGGGQTAFSTYWTAKNKTKYIMQHSSNYCRVIGLLYLFFYDSLRLLYRENHSNVRNHIKGVIDGYKQRAVE